MFIVTTTLTKPTAEATFIFYLPKEHALKLQARESINRKIRSPGYGGREASISGDGLVLTVKDCWATEADHTAFLGANEEFLAQVAADREVYETDQGITTVVTTETITT